MKTNVFVIIFYFILTLSVFRNIFFGQTISGGDYVVFWPENLTYLRSFAFFAWDATVNFGFNTVGSLHSAPYSWYMGWMGVLVGNQMAWWERVVWWAPFFIFSLLTSSILVKKLFPENKFWFFAPFIFLFNTYVFMMIGGGQIGGIGLAYSIAPAVLLFFIYLINSFQKGYKTHNIKLSLLAGLLFAVQVMFDLRIAYITLISVVLYIVFSILYLVSKRKARDMFLLFFYSLILPLGITGLLHAFWIIPMVLFRVNTIEQLGAAFSSQEAVKFFSFATFENTLSLLHPNWPENLFGKTYFMKPEFLVIPLLAFSALLFTNRIILFFALLGIVGAFLAKGANDPFGFVYLWLFDHVPGFVMFRDPTKWYLLIAISYSVLIPFSLWQIYQWLQGRVRKISQKNLRVLFISSVFLVLLFIIRPVFGGELSGTFKPVTMAEEYVQLKKYISQKNHYSKTLWIPHRHRFVYQNSLHPAVDADSFLQSSPSALLSVLKKPINEQRFQEAGIKYVVLPDDLQKELFLVDNKYNEKLYQKYRKELNTIPWLKKSEEFGQIVVYEVTSPKDKFWVTEEGRVVYQTINPATYIVSLSTARKGEVLVFNETYDQNWRAREKNTQQEIISTPYGNKYNSFVLPHDGDYEFVISYIPQQWVGIGGWISLVTLLVISILLFKKR